jgi:LCP family protein required for cell wall assembly
MNSEQTPQTAVPANPNRRFRWRYLVFAAPVLAVALAAVVIALLGQSPASSATASPTLTPSPLPTASATPSPTPLPTPAPLNAALLDHRFTVLVVGEDQSAARRARGYIGDNTDAIMVVSVSPKQKRVVMVSVPRDTVDVPLANGQIWTRKVNGIANVYGIDVLRKAMQTLLGTKIPYYVKVNMDDFVDLVDAVGGIRVKVKTLVQEPRWGIYLTPGTRAHLDGREALYFTRARHFDSDYARAARQQQVIRALVQKYTNRKTHVDLPKLIGTLAGLETNLPLKDLRTLTVVARRAVDADYVAEVLAPPRFALDWGDQGDGRGWVIIPNVAAMRDHVRQLFGN